MSEISRRSATEQPSVIQLNRNFEPLVDYEGMIPCLGSRDDLLADAAFMRELAQGTFSNDKRGTLKLYRLMRLRPLYKLLMNVRGGVVVGTHPRMKMMRCNSKGRWRSGGMSRELRIGGMKAASSHVVGFGDILFGPVKGAVSQGECLRCTLLRFLNFLFILSL